MIENEKLPTSDRRTPDGLKTKYCKEAKSFQLHCQKVQRAKTSGCECDDDGVPINLEPPTHETVSTPIFWKYDIQSRPSSIPPHSIDGGNAAKGGETNHFESGKAKRGRAAAEAAVDSGDEAGAGDDSDADEFDESEPEVVGDDDEDDDFDGEPRAPKPAGAGKPSGKAAKPMNVGGGSSEKYRPKKPKTGPGSRGGAGSSAPKWVSNMIEELKKEDATARAEEKKEDDARRAEQRTYDEKQMSKLLAAFGANGGGA